MSTEPLSTLSTPVPLLYSFCGFAGSGKNTAGEIVRSLHTPSESLSFAAALKDAMVPIFGFDREMLEGTSTETRALREVPDPYWSKVFERPMTPRRLLQEFGTDCVRQWRPDLWVHAALRRIQSHVTTVFTDTRFGNEMWHLRQFGAQQIWVYRPVEPDSISYPLDRAAQTVVNQRAVLTSWMFMEDDTRHASETSFLSEGAPNLQIVVINDGTMRRLTRLIHHLDFKLQEFVSGGGSHALGSFIPYGDATNPTLYLSSVNGDLVWEYRPNFDDTIRRCWFNDAHQFLFEDSIEKKLPL